MPGQLLSGVPILISNDFDATVAFYRRLGFKEIDRHEHHYLILRRDGCELHFRPGSGHDPVTAPPSAYVRMLNVAAFHVDCSALDLPAHGIPRYRPPKLESWGMIESNLRDPDGNLLVFGAADEESIFTDVSSSGPRS